jgi:hypothetical protein
MERIRLLCVDPEKAIAFSGLKIQKNGLKRQEGEGKKKKPPSAPPWASNEPGKDFLPVQEVDLAALDLDDA